MGVVSASYSANMLVTLLLASLVAGFAQGSYLGYAVYNVDGSTYYPSYYPAAGRTHYSYAPVTHAYGNVNHPVGTPYLYTLKPADIPYGEQDRREGYSYSAPVLYSTPVVYPARYHYSYAPATHAYGNVNHPVATPYLYTRKLADIPYGEQDREGYSYSAPVVYPTPVVYPARHHYSYAPPVTHAYGNVNHPVATPYLYTLLPADIPHGEQDREGYSYSRVVPGYALGQGTAIMYRRVDPDYYRYGDLW